MIFLWAREISTLWPGFLLKPKEHLRETSLALAVGQYGQRQDDATHFHTQNYSHLTWASVNDSYYFNSWLDDAKMTMKCFFGADICWMYELGHYANYMKAKFILIEILQGFTFPRRHGNKSCNLIDSYSVLDFPNSHHHVNTGVKSIIMFPFPWPQNSQCVVYKLCWRTAGQR